MKISLKIILLFTGIVSCILLGMALLIFGLSKENVNRDFRQQIRSRAGRAAYLYDLFKTDTTNLLKSIDANAPTVLSNKSIQIYDTTGKLIYDFQDPKVSEVIPKQEWFERVMQKEEIFSRRGEKDIGFFLFNRKIIVLLAAENISGRAYIHELRKIVVIYFPLAVLVTLLAGYLFSRTITKPIRQTIHDVKLITTQNLSHRLFTGKSKDELAELNQTFNALLNRLEESFAMEKRFISNASHELSTPLTSVSSQIDVALLQDRSIDEYKKVLSSVLNDVKGLHQLVRNLLEIAKAGSHGVIMLEKLRIDEILVKAWRDASRMNNTCNIEILIPELPEDENECTVFGNSHLLQSAFKNIMENGCKYSPDGKTKMELETRGEEAVIIFSNKSEFLPSEELEKLFEPFYRGENATNKAGFGLGLTLTQRIIHLHKGELTIHSDPSGETKIRIVLPTLKR
jgi:two-component system, OmpR family, sensor histidine kinase ArlS